MVLWLWNLGMPLWGVAVFLFFALVIFVALTRVIAEGGVALIYTPMVAADAAVSAVGTSAFFGPAGLVGLAFTRILGNDLLNFAMPHVANGLKLSEQIEGRRRRLFWGMLAAILLGMAGSLWMLLHLAYTTRGDQSAASAFYLAADLSRGLYGRAHRQPLGAVLAGLVPRRGRQHGHGTFDVGAALLGLVAAASHRLSHQLYLPLDGFQRLFSLAFQDANPALRWGKRIPDGAGRFFSGLVLGQFAIYGVFWVIDGLTGHDRQRPVRLGLWSRGDAVHPQAHAAEAIGRGKGRKDVHPTGDDVGPAIAV